MTDDSVELVSEATAAQALNVAHGTLKQARLGLLPNSPLRSVPYVRIGRAIRYRRKDIEAWIRDHTVTPGGGVA